MPPHAIESSVLNCLSAFVWGSISDTILPESDERKKPMVLAFEIAIQLLLFYFALVYIPQFVSNFSVEEPSSRYHDKLVVLVLLVGTQLNLLKKIDTLKESTIRCFFSAPDPQNKIITGSTPLEDLNQ